MYCFCLEKYINSLLPRNNENKRNKHVFLTKKNKFESNFHFFNINKLRYSQA